MAIRLDSYSEIARKGEELHRVWVLPVNQEDARCWLIHNGAGYYCKAVGYPEPGIVGIGYVHLFTDYSTAFEVRMRFT